MTGRELFKAYAGAMRSRNVEIGEWDEQEWSDRESFDEIAASLDADVGALRKRVEDLEAQLKEKINE